MSNVKAYEKLSIEERRLFQVLAVSEAEVELSELTKMLVLSKFSDIPKTGITQKVVKTWCEGLKQKGFARLVTSRKMRVVEQQLDFGVQRAVHEATLDAIENAITTTKAGSKSRYGHYYTSPRTNVADQRRRARVAFYRHDVSTFQTEIRSLETSHPSEAELHLLSSFDAELFERTPDVLKEMVLQRSVRRALESGTGSLTLLEIFDAYAYSQTELDPEFGQVWVNLCVGRGDLAGLSELVELQQSFSPLAAACRAFLLGQHAEADAAFAKITNPTGRKPMLLPDLAGLMQVLLLLRKNDENSRETLMSLCARMKKGWRSPFSPCSDLLKSAIEFSQSPTATAKMTLTSAARTALRYGDLLPCVLGTHIGYWFIRKEKFAEAEYEWEATATRKDLIDITKRYSELGLDWLCAMCEDTIQVVSQEKESSVALGARHQKLGTQPMLKWIQPVAAWRAKLDVLRAIATGKTAKAKAVAATPIGDERMIWELETRASGDNLYASARPLLQKLSGKTWTKGRPVALERLYRDLESAAFACLSDHDRAICQCIESYETPTGYYRYTETVYNFDNDRLMVALVGHPCVFTSGNREQPIEIIAKDPQLVVSRKKNGVRLCLEPRPEDNCKVVLKKDGAQRIVVVSFTEQQLKLADALEAELDVPAEAVDEVLDVAKKLSLIVSVQSEVEFDDSSNSVGAIATANKSVPADARPQLHLLPFHAGLRVEFFVQPFGAEGPCFVPGQGGANVCANVSGELIATRRDLKLEWNAATQLVSACSALANQFDGKCLQFEFPTADEALEMLLEVEPLREQQALTLQWPQGQSLKIAGQVDGPQLKVRVARDRDWFAASGELVVDASLQLDMLQLFDLVAATPSRFVQLSDGRFLALTERLRQRVSELVAFGERTPDSLRFPQIRAAALTDLDEWCSLKADKHWKSHLKKITEAGDVVADVPSTLDAELRDYQVEGFRWLCRLAHWGAGACLADDMGLGKTLQAIALLLRRGTDGPALVIAPTSVCFNWQSELSRFAPTLNPRVFGSGDRDAFFEELGPRDVVIVSYGLLNTEIERLQATHWHTAILDEAQAIKNMQTKRSQAAMSLNADFRLIMTGTPIENHLGELWNLFQFINPGLLGSIEQYQQRFAVPIERDQSREVRQQLKRLVQPFLLRRTKQQVLSELPPRIEVTVPVTLSEEETALYEAARHRALKQLTSDTDARGKHLRILAEIMRLRRACCHPSLLLPDCGISGSKLAAFSEKIDELIENRHKALVFSQFVDHLAILKAELDRKGVKYQYLDGSTPAVQRKKSVDAFQNGEGDVFLISLKAGGTGLNLTAADYVLHMDPWWNPAVEDQAADRAHRMGQLRPVTIYRFITRGTIEDKILELHATKRDLADSLLEGTDTTGRLSADELLALMK